MAVIGKGAKWHQIYEHTTNLFKPGFDMNVIKMWRTCEHDAGRPSSLQDFYQAQGICWECRCLGFQITGYDEQDKEQLYSPCATCGGTGRVPSA